MEILCYWKLDTSESTLEMSGDIWNVMVVEKGGEYQLDRSCEKWSSIGENQGGEKYPTNNEKKEG